MIQGTATLVIDLGNSSTKCNVLFGKDGTGKYKERRFDLPNIFSGIDSDYVVAADYNDRTSFIIRADVDYENMHLEGNYCCGELQEKEKPLSTIKPSASQKKYNLESSLLSYRLAFMQAMRELMYMQGVTDIAQMNITWKVITLLPPGDLDIGKEKISAIIKGVDHIDSVYPNMYFDVKIQSVCVLPEGYCAYAGVVFDKGHTYRQAYKCLTEENVLVFDVGAGTTDCLLIRNNKLVQNSKYTCTQGGNNVYHQVRRILRARGIDLNDEDIRQGILVGYVKVGSQRTSIIDVVNQAKANVAAAILSEIQDFFTAADIKIQSIGYVLVCGGGSMANSECEDIMTLGEKIIERINQLSENTLLIELPTHMVSKETADGDIQKVEERISPRDLNLVGASILAEIL